MCATLDSLPLGNTVCCRIFSCLRSISDTEHYTVYYCKPAAYVYTQLLTLIPHTFLCLQLSYKVDLIELNGIIDVHALETHPEATESCPRL